jgi:hypothetical protein
MKDIAEIQKSMTVDFNVFKSNYYFLKDGNIGRRLIPELVFTHFDFTNISETVLRAMNPFSSRDGLGGFFSINCMDISIPGKGLAAIEQNIFNVVKSFPSGLDNSSKNQINIKLVESRNFDVSLMINNYIHINNSVHSRVMRAYPNDLKFDIYVFPLRWNNSNLEFSDTGAVIVGENCMFRSFDDWDFDLSGNKSDIVLKSVNMSFEKLYLTNKYGN